MSGLRYSEFRKTLTPRYRKVWGDILMGYGGLLLIGVVFWVVQFPLWPIALLAALLGSIGFGYLHHYLALFMHEAAHFNLTSSRKTNDLMTNIFLGVLQGYSVETYRPTHFGHHREIGNVEDPEHHYFHALDLRLIFLTLSGIRTAKGIGERLFSTARRTLPASSQPSRSGFNWVVLAGGFVHGAIIVGAIMAGKWPLSVAWIIGFLIWFPFFSTLRQILEHRDFHASPNTDFTQIRHGAITRIFSDGPLASTFGAAGFSRHLLHHWEPQISYTRLRELERFLLDTEAGPIIRAQRETYLSTFRKLVK